MKKIAIIGSGISGLSAAYFLRDRYQITLYEQGSRLGGHSRTIKIHPKGAQELAVDTGFIVLNDTNYPLLLKLFKELQIELVKTEMSFAVFTNHGMEWGGKSLNTLFAQRKNIFNLRFLAGLRDLLKFNYNALAIVNKDPLLTLGELIKQMDLGEWFKEYYILPMGGAIWSCSFKQILSFPAVNLVNFFNNHGLLNLYNRPQWYTLKDKSISYIKAINAVLADCTKIIKNSRIHKVNRVADKVNITLLDGTEENFDYVIFAIHPVEILNILEDPTIGERQCLEKFSRQKNIAYTHSDPNQMPKLSRCWSSWNVCYNKNNYNKEVAITYWMNKLQHLDPKNPVFVTLNPVNNIPEDYIYDIYEFYHPVFDFNSIVGQRAIWENQGNNHLWFCGAYLRNGFHEDGIWSAHEVAQKLGDQIK